MKKFKKVLALSLALAMGLSLVACGNDGGNATTAAPADDDGDATTEAAKVEVPEDTGSVLNIWCWNDEFQSRVADYYPDYKANDDGTGSIGDITVNWVVTPNENNAYQDALDTALLAQADASEEDKIDIFLIEADYALKYVNADASLDVTTIGLTADDMADQYQYTKDIVTDSTGAIKGTTWQATPGLFAYRRSIAKEVLGTDDPTEVQAALADWDKFDAVAAQAKEKGYFMLSGYDDAYRVFSNNVSAPWVNENNEIVIDDSIMKWVDQTKEYTDNGYNNKSSLWDATWAKDQGSSGKVFGFFYSTWGINFTLLGNSLDTSTDDGGKEEVGNGCFGDYAVCEGPAAYYWGGTWVCAATGTDNPNLVCDVMRKLTCDAGIMKSITEGTQDYTNNQAAMEELANSDFKSDFLGGQNHIALFAEAAPKIDMSNAGAYDQGCNESFQGAFKDYFEGKVDKDTALDNFYKTVMEKYPELKKAE